MSAKSENLKDERGAFVLAPLPVMRGCFAVLVPENMKWEVQRVSGGYRLDFSPMTPEERVLRLRDWRPQ